jgi:hypothetical protein
MRVGNVMDRDLGWGDLRVGVTIDMVLVGLETGSFTRRCMLLEVEMRLQGCRVHKKFSIGASWGQTYCCWIWITKFNLVCL